MAICNSLKLVVLLIASMGLAMEECVLARQAGRDQDVTNGTVTQDVINTDNATMALVCAFKAGMVDIAPYVSCFCYIYTPSIY